MAERYGFHIVSDAHNAFNPQRLFDYIDEAVLAGRGPVTTVILDTAKKFTNPMDKQVASAFSAKVRRAVARGVTVIVLNHVNKNRTSDGDVVPAGTSDLTDDFDCAYTLQAHTNQAEPGRRTVVYKSVKGRGNVVELAAYSYSLDRSLPYDQLLASVRVEDVEQLGPGAQAAPVDRDAVAAKGAKVYRLLDQPEDPSEDP